MKKLSKNKKLNMVLNMIYESLDELGIEEVKRYKDSFPHEIDFNIAQYGNVLVYHEDVENLYKNCGYKVENYNNLWEVYKRQVGYIARNYF
jgi:hypothetical protein